MAQLIRWEIPIEFRFDGWSMGLYRKGYEDGKNGERISDADLLLKVQEDPRYAKAYVAGLEKGSSI